MNRTVAFFATFALVTALAACLHHGLRGSAEAARSSPEDVARAREARKASPSETKGLSLANYTLNEQADPSDLLLARVAHDCAVCLLEKSRRNPGEPRLLEQAAQHLRACLSHEPAGGQIDPLFREARQQLQQVEKQLARGNKPAPDATPKEAKSPTSTGTPEETSLKVTVQDTPSETTPETGKEEAPAGTIGPDGVPIRRSGE
jgi:hypothetical protein